MQAVTTTEVGRLGCLAAEHDRRNPNLTEEVPCITPVEVVLVPSVSSPCEVVCTFPPFLQRDNPKFIRSQGTMISKLDYVELGLTWTDACAALGCEMNGRRLGELNRSVCEVIRWQLTTRAQTVVHIVRVSHCALIAAMRHKHRGRLSRRGNRIDSPGLPNE